VCAQRERGGARQVARCERDGDDGRARASLVGTSASASTITTPSTDQQRE
jgi:hypothetical protein